MTPSRLFVAVWPPDEVLDAIEALPRPSVPGVRWVGRSRWHVTVRFLGEAEPEEAEAALGRVDAAPALAEVGPEVVRLGRSVVCVPVGGLDAVASAVVDATAHVGRPPEQRPFRGHLTIGRLRRRRASALEGHPIGGSFPVAEVALVESVLGGDGPTYRTLAVHPLSAAPPP